MAPHFVVVTHPDRFKERDLMRRVRRSVMFNYLAKERRKLNGGTESPARAAHRASPKTNVRPRHCSSTARPSQHDNQIGQALQRDATEARPPQGRTSSQQQQRHQQLDDGSRPSLPMLATDTARMMPLSHCNTAASPLVYPPMGSLYRRTSISVVPFPVSCLGGDINPFNTWPTLQSHVNTHRLKYQCSEFFGSAGMAVSWVPILLTARHAFLSTICVSAAYQDIMRRVQQSPAEQTPLPLTDLFRVNTEVVRMINKAFDDPDARVADATIIAVLQVLSSEIMGCNDSVLTIHQNGLLCMVRERGGLANLGVDGCLASILTVNMYMIYALRETIPHRDFEEWASHKSVKPIVYGSRKFPESPIYCRSSGFEPVRRTFTPDHPTYQLLDALRLLTKSFWRTSYAALINPTTPVSPASPGHDSPRARIMALHDRIFQTPRASSYASSSFSSPPALPFADDNAQQTFEALRLTAQLYAYALNNELPFSVAAATLSEKKQDPIHVCIKRHLQATALEDCWGDLAGVLFWITLVAGAAANPTSSPTSSAVTYQNHQASDPDSNHDESESDKARTWLSAVAVRCAILLAFEHPGAVLETLRRVVGTEQALATAHAAAAAAASDAAQVLSVPPPGHGSAVESFHGTVSRSHPSDGAIDPWNDPASSRMPRANMETSERGMGNGQSEASDTSNTTLTTTNPFIGPADLPFLHRRSNFQDFAIDP